MPAASSQIQYRTPGLTFSTDWFEANAQHWPLMFRWLHWEPRSILEIGCFEGAATCWMREYFGKVNISVIDTFEGSPDHTVEQRTGLRARFDANVRCVQEYLGDQPFTFWPAVMAEPSRIALPKLVEHANRDPLTRPFDFIYLDGSHEAPDVLSDLVLSWELLSPGGLLVCDDFEWGGGDGPRLAVHAFMSCYEAQIDLERSPLQQGAQFAFVKCG